VLILLLIVLALLVVVGGVVAVLMVVSRHQKQTIAFDNEVVPGMPSNAPPSWAGSHDPEARLHRRLRDAIRALHGVNAYDTASSVNLRAGLEQSALAVDNHLIAIAGLPQPHRDQALPDATGAVEAIEAGVAQYASATTKPDPIAFEAGLQGVQTSIDAVTSKIQAVGPGQPPVGVYPGQPAAAHPQPGGAYQQPSAGGGYPQPPIGPSHQQPSTGGGYPPPYPQTSGGTYPPAPAPGHADPTVRREY